MLLPDLQDRHLPFPICRMSFEWRYRVAYGTSQWFRFDRNTPRKPVVRANEVFRPVNRPSSGNDRLSSGSIMVIIDCKAPLVEFGPE
jgi:hypothetical protein